MHPLPITVAFITEAIKRLRSISAPYSSRGSDTDEHTKRDPWTLLEEKGVSQLHSSSTDELKERDGGALDLWRGSP